MREIDIDPDARAELLSLRPFDARPVFRAIAELRHQADFVSRNRKPLRELLDSLPEASWEVRVGRHRVLYCIHGRTVRVLRVILKGSGTTNDALGRSKP